jgi:predicted nucleotidyltransferase
LGGKNVAKLKGENQIEKFRKVAERLSSKISFYEGVTGIIFVGGLARCFADRFSDLDITVFLGKDDEPLRTRIRDIGLNEEKRSSIEMGYLVFSFITISPQTLRFKHNPVKSKPYNSNIP